MLPHTCRSSQGIALTARPPAMPHLIPALMKDWTNCLWKIKKPISKGAAVSKVAAVMIDQSIPWSLEEKTCRPTVRGLDSTELQTTRGQRKLFQWWLIETSAKAT